MPNRGLFIFHAGPVNAHLDLFELTVWDADQTPNRFPPVPKVATSAEEAIKSFDAHAHRITWLSGPAATKKLARSVGLTYRKRAPGAGRKVTLEHEKAVYVPVWMSPGGRDRLDFLRGKRPRGAFIEKHLPLMK